MTAKSVVRLLLGLGLLAALTGANLLGGGAAALLVGGSMLCLAAFFDILKEKS